jgi:hypothetical protein
MNEARLSSASGTRGPKSLGPVTRKMLHERTCEIARLAGRSAPYVTQDDYEQAKRELTGDPYALIMDTTIDTPWYVPNLLARHVMPPVTEVASSPLGQHLGETPVPRLFFEANCPLTGAT